MLWLYPVIVLKLKYRLVHLENCLYSCIYTAIFTGSKYPKKKLRILRTNSLVVPVILLKEQLAERVFRARWQAENSCAFAGVGGVVREEFLGLDTVQLCRNNGTVLRQFMFKDCAGGPHELIGV